MGNCPSLNLSMYGKLSILNLSMYGKLSIFKPVHVWETLLL